MPYAPSVLDTQCEGWFKARQPDAQMQFAFQCRSERAQQIPAVVHVDGTARLQSVSPTNSPILYRVLREFYELTGTPVLLNTSMNTRGEPIVETPEEAVELLRVSDLDAIAFGDNLVVVRPEVAVGEDLTKGVEEVGIAKRWLTLASGTPLTTMREAAQRSFPDLDIAFRGSFGLRGEYCEWLRSGRKSTTIRYKAGAVDLPLKWALPLEVKPSVGNTAACLAKILEVHLKRYAELSEDDAKNDGFSNLDDLRRALIDFYGNIPGTAVVSIYHIAVS